MGDTIIVQHDGSKWSEVRAAGGGWGLFSATDSHAYLPCSYSQMQTNLNDVYYLRDEKISIHINQTLFIL